MSKNGNISSAGSSPATSPQTPHRKPNKVKKLKGLKGIKPKMLQKFKMAAQKVNKAQEYIDKTRYKIKVVKSKKQTFIASKCRFNFKCRS